LAPLLIALGSCHEALVQQPLLAALRAARLAHTVAWFGTAEALVEARALGLPEAVVAPAAPAPERPEQRLARLAAFAAELLAGPWSLLVLAGHGTFAPMLAAMARSARLPVLRLGAGVRTHRGPGDAPRRAADHAADAWCTANEERRQQLLREGARADAVFVVGEPLGEALAKLPAAQAAPVPAASIVLAFEHMQSLQPPEAAAAMLDALTGARGAVPLLVVPTLPVFADPTVRLPVGCRRLEGGATAQLHAALGARVVVTDSAGWQDLCAQAGVPCLVPASAGALPELLGAGAIATFGTEPGQLQATLQRLAGSPRQPAPIAGTAAATLAAIDTLRQPGSKTMAPAAAPTALPSDGDASGRTLGEDEVALVSMAIRRGTLNSTRGTFVTTFEQRFAKWLGRKHAIACGSGSAAVHVALACLQLQPGDEVITTPITDMGALTPILYEGAVPVFADVDPRTLNVTAATIAAQLTDRTRAIVVTHLFGLPCELAAILELAEQRGIPVIEDSAQAFGATYRGRRIGTFGRLAAFSLQQGKHITTGEGGIVATDDDALARRAFLYVNKAWGYGDPKPDHYFPALNYRLTELQGAVAVAQLPKLDGVVGARRAVAAALQHELAGVAGLVLPQDPEHGTHSWWKFAFRVDPAQIPGGAVALGKRMQQTGIACVPRYVQKPAFECELFRDWSKSPVTWLPLQHNPRRERPQPLYHRGDYPGACEGLEHVVVLPINERYTDAHVRTVATAIAAAATELRRG
jgi:dTDP-4-amino-4,6-dideoxygalactose transaminase